MLLLFMLVVVHLMEGGTAGQDKEADKGEAKDDDRGVFTMDGNKLSAFNCEEGQTKVMKMPTHEDCVVAGGKRRSRPVWKGDFAIIQRRRTQDTKVTSCELVQSEMTGHCGWLSHFSFSKIPDIEAPRFLSLDECRMAHLQGKMLIGGVFHSVEPGLNLIKVIEKGNLIYDANSESVSCTDEAGREGKEGEMHLKSELKMVIYQLTISSAPARLRMDTERMVITAGPHEGLELTPLEVRAGGKSLEHVTILVDDDIRLDHCPYSVLRERVHLEQFDLFGKGQMGKNRDLGEPVHSRGGLEDKELAGVALVGESVAVRLKTKVSPAKQCAGLSGSGEIYLTNHEDVLAVHLDGTDNLEQLKGNRQHLDELQEDLVTASRLDLLAFHVDQAFKNLSLEVDKGGCLQNLDDLGNILDEDPRFKSRALPAGEAIILSQCKHVKVLPYWDGRWVDKAFCPKYLPVRIIGDLKKTQRYLEPRSRFLYKASPMQDCAISHLVPIYLETKKGEYVSFNGTEFKLQDVTGFNWAEKLKYYQEPGLDFWKDMSTLGLLNQKEVDDLEIFQEYSVYLTRSDQLDRPSHEGTSSGSGKGRMQSWVTEMRDRMGLGMGTLVEDGTGIGEAFTIWGRMKAAWDEVKDWMVFWGTLGGVLYSIKVFGGAFLRLLRAVCRSRSKEELKEETKEADRWGCQGDAVGRALCIVCTEVFVGSDSRRKAKTKKMVKDMVDEGTYEAKAHMRDLVLSGRRGSTQAICEKLELSPLVNKAKV